MPARRAGIRSNVGQRAVSTHTQRVLIIRQFGQDSRGRVDVPQCVTTPHMLLRHGFPVGVGSSLGQHHGKTWHLRSPRRWSSCGAPLGARVLVAGCPGARMGMNLIHPFMRSAHMARAPLPVVVHPMRGAPGATHRLPICALCLTSRLSSLTNAVSLQVHARLLHSSRAQRLGDETQSGLRGAG